jgi:hypothetical protein
MQDTAKHKRGKIVMRILSIVDVMAPRRRGMTCDEITAEVNESTGESFSSRTIMRDLRTMHLLGFMSRIKSNNSQGRGTLYIWTLSLGRSTQLQEVACKALPQPKEVNNT